MRTDVDRGPEPPNGWDPLTNLAQELCQKVVGQPGAIRSIIPYVEMFQAGLAPAGRPVGVFLLLGPTGTGKTRTVEALAEVLHGSDRKLVKIDCAEFQMEHEVARLIGAPPGYLGHRETQPLITQKRLAAATSERNGLSIVLFDEIEKAAPSLSQLLLGVLDKATLHLGDNTAVSFENSVVFLTSNLGAREMFRELRPDFGYHAALPAAGQPVVSKLERIGLGALRRHFSPEFVNRIDAVVTYGPLSRESLEAILLQQVADFQELIYQRLGAKGFELRLSPESAGFLIAEGTCPEYGARELKRVIHRHLIQPVSARVARGELPPASTVHVVVDTDGRSLKLVPRPGVEPIRAKKTAPATARTQGRLRLTA